MWQAFALFGGIMAAVAIKSVMELLKLRDEPYRSATVGRPPGFADRATAACHRCGSRDVRLFPYAWYYCRKCGYGGNLN